MSGPLDIAVPQTSICLGADPDVDARCVVIVVLKILRTMRQHVMIAMDPTNIGQLKD